VEGSKKLWPNGKRNFYPYQFSLLCSGYQRTGKINGEDISENAQMTPPRDSIPLEALCCGHISGNNEKGKRCVRK
jgi:hypothetical protein